MYVPQYFLIKNIDICHRLIRDHGFGELITVDPEGASFASHLPFMLDPARGQFGTLTAHVARANPQWRHFASGRAALAIFHGPHAYVSPQWYGTEEAVPTWNYLAVHAYGVPQIIEDANEVLRYLRALSGAHEAANGTAWRMEGLPEDYLARMVKGLVAFETQISRIEGKAKLSQNRGEEDQLSVASALAGSNDPFARALAKEMPSKL